MNERVMKGMDFTLEEFETSFRIDYKGITINIDTVKEDARGKVEILSLMNSGEKTYSCMCVSTGMPFSHIENFNIIECINKNLIALEKLNKLDDFKNKYSEGENEYNVYLKSIIEE